MSKYQKRKREYDEESENSLRHKEFKQDTTVKDWKFWGPYLSERQWGTVREDYSHDQNCWNYIDFDKSARYSYKWGEDGLLGWSDNQGRLCTSIALWNGKDEILKERLFGLSGPQGNHGEDVKELYYYIDGTPDHCYNKAVYKYPQTRFPYKQLVDENKTRSSNKTEFEIIDTGIFEKGYWDVNIEYIKDSPDITYCCCTIQNNGEITETLHVVPQVWFRNTWNCSRTTEQKPKLQKISANTVEAVYVLGNYLIEFLPNRDEDVEIIFTDNETSASLKMTKSTSTTNNNQYYKDAFHEYIINDNKTSINPHQIGTKCAAVYVMTVRPGEHKQIYWTILPSSQPHQQTSIEQIQNIIKQRKRTCDLFYSTIIADTWSPEEKNVARQAIAGLLWSKQFYYYHVQTHQTEVKRFHNDEKTAVLWNIGWEHLINHDIISVPDKWEFPWYAMWDLAFHMIVYSLFDASFSKRQMLLFLSDRYMKANGQLPGCEFDFEAANPPLQAWACYRIYKNDNSVDKEFLQTCFHQLMKQFNWWSEMLDPQCCYLYTGGFLGLDNISIIDRTASTLPPDSQLLQADGTGWMAFYCLSMLEISIELSSMDSSFLDNVEKFVDQVLLIADKINQSISTGGLWDDEDGFFYDVLILCKERIPLKIQSLVGIVPLFACRQFNLTLPESSLLYKKLNNSQYIKRINHNIYFISLVKENRLKDILNIVFREKEFLSQFGIRSLSKIYETDYIMEINGESKSLRYTPGESTSDIFGGNSNWRGPIWLPMNYLFVESLKMYDTAYNLKITYPSHSDTCLQTSTIIKDICKRITSLFLPDKNSFRPLHGKVKEYSDKWKDLVLFYEYFNAETGQGCGASHQTGWTSLFLLFNTLAQ